MAQSHIFISYPDTLQPFLRQLPATEMKGDAEEAALQAEKILTILERNGYPFAEVRMTTKVQQRAEQRVEQHVEKQTEKQTEPRTEKQAENIKYEKKEKSENGENVENEAQKTYHLQVIANNYIRWDSIVIKGDAKLSPRFLAPYLKIRRGKAYDEQLVKQAKTALEALDYITVLQVPKPSFTKDAAALYLYLNKKNANTFDGYVGFTSKENGQGVQLFGQFNLKFQNIFGHGESFSAAWNRLQQNYQTLTLELEYPCLLQTPFCLYGQFYMLRNDTNFYRISIPAGVKYLLGGTNYLQLYYRYETNEQKGGSGQNGTGGSGQNGGGSSGQTGGGSGQNGGGGSGQTGGGSGQNITQSKTNSYGIGIGFKQIDNHQIPRKGYNLESNLELGKKKITDVEQNSLTWRGTFSGSLYIPIGRRWVQANRLLAGHMYDTQLFESNLFLMGGLRSLRGVNEQSLAASSYCFISEEIRFLLNNNMFAQIFADGGWYERKLSSQYHRDFPVGVGAGFSLLTKTGLFSISYALSAHDNQGFKFKSAKISIGFNAFF